MIPNTYSHKNDWNACSDFENRLFSFFFFKFAVVTDKYIIFKSQESKLLSKNIEFPKFNICIQNVYNEQGVLEMSFTQMNFLIPVIWMNHLLHNIH